MAFQTDSPRDKVMLFEDFVGWDIVADQAEVGVSTDPATEVVSGGIDGIVRITMDAGQSNVGGIEFGQLQWDISNGITLEARVRLSAIGAADERVFVGLHDAKTDTVSEFPFTIATTVLTAAANPDDAIGFVWEGNSTNASWYAASQNNDSVVIDGVANQTKYLAPVAATWNTLKMEIAPGATHVEFSVDGEHLYTYDGATAAVDDVALIPVFMGTEGTTAINADIDYMYVESRRSA